MLHRNQKDLLHSDFIESIFRRIERVCSQKSPCARVRERAREARGPMARMCRVVGMADCHLGQEGATTTGSAQCLIFRASFFLFGPIRFVGAG